MIGRNASATVLHREEDLFLLLLRRQHNASGQRFALGSGLSDVMRRNPPPVGAWVTYRFRDRTPSGLPRFASFLRVREAE